MLRTSITERYGIQHPFVGAGMGIIGMPPLVAAVSNAGGLGVLGAGLLPPDVVRQCVAGIRSMTDKPFGVNFLTQFTAPEHIDVVIEDAVPLVTFHWNELPTEYIKSLQAAGIPVWTQVGTVRMAVQAAELGVDAIIVQGSEAGGHVRGEASMAALLPAVADAVGGTVALIAAGGIGDGRGAAAAFALGADAVWVGTRLVATVEASAHDEWKRRLVQAGPGDTKVTTLFGPEWPDAPFRVLRNRVVEEWADKIDEISDEVRASGPIGTTTIGADPYEMPKFSVMMPIPATTGDFEEMALAAGESVGVVHDITTVADIVARMMADAEALITGRLAHLVQHD